MGVQFAQPGLLALLTLVPLFAVGLWWRARARARRLRALGDAPLVRALTAGVSTRRRVWQALCWLAALALAVIAAARPVWGVDTSVVETQGASVMVVLDVSRSMDAQDVAPSRLDRAKLFVRDLAEQTAGNEVGLVVFAGQAFMMFPLTTDFVSASSLLNAVSSDAISQQGTAIGVGLQTALDAFNERTATERIVVVISDGENHDEATQQALAAAVNAGVVIHTVGMGTPQGATIPVRDAAGNVTGNLADRAGSTVVTTLNETLLRDMAARTGGTYQAAYSEGTDVTRLAALINNAQAVRLGTSEEVRGVERFVWFAALALAALSLEMLLPDVRGTA